MNENGGIVDDTVITKCDDHMYDFIPPLSYLSLSLFLTLSLSLSLSRPCNNSYMVVNGACKEKDIQHFTKYLQSTGHGNDVTMFHDSSRQLLALQVPFLLLSLFLSLFLRLF